MKKFAVLFTLITVIAVITSMMLVPAYADETDVAVDDVTVEETAAVEHDHDGDGVPDHDASAHETTPAVEHDHDGDGVADHEETKAPVTWNNFTEGASGYIAIAIAVVLLVGTVTAIILLAPKRGKQK